MIKTIGIILLSFLIASCGSGMRNTSLNKMGNSNIGDPYYIYESRSKSLDYYTITDLEYDSEYKLIVYSLNIYTDPEALFNDINEYCHVVYTFENDTLLFFGFPEDYLRSDDKGINNLGMKLADVIKTARDKE